MLSIFYLDAFPFKGRCGWDLIEFLGVVCFQRGGADGGHMDVSADLSQLSFDQLLRLLYRVWLCSYRIDLSHSDPAPARDAMYSASACTHCCYWCGALCRRHKVVHKHRTCSKHRHN